VHIDRLTATGRISKADLLAAFMDIYNLGRHAGNLACRKAQRREEAV
jgi:hypothetical protein